MVSTPPDPVYTFRKKMALINCLLLRSKNNDELLYVGTAEGLVHIWDLKLKREVKNIKVGDKECLAIARQGDKFISQERGLGLKYWREEQLDWFLLQTITVDYYGFCKFLVYNDEIYCPFSNGIVSIFQGENTKMICDYAQKRQIDQRGEVMCMKYLEQRSALLTAYESGILSLWIFYDAIPKIKSEKLFEGTPMCLDYCESTREGILGTSSESLKKFSIVNDIICESRSTTLTNPGVSSVTLSKDGKLMVAGCWDGKVRYFSMKNLSLLAVLDHHSGGAIQCVLFSEDLLTSCPVGALFAAGSDSRISLWNLYTNRKRT